MPEPVTTGELLLQQIADDLRDVKALLGRESAPPAPEPAIKGPAKKATSKRTRKDVDGR